MEIITLEKVSLSDLTACFNQAFSDYFIKFSATESYLQQRWKGAGIDFSLSSGVMDKDKLVGFIVNGVRERNGVKTAFNAGTGVIPTHRGNGLTEKMYQFMMPKFIENEIQSLALEVIQENLKAVHVYEKVGLKIKRGFHCFKGEIKIDSPLSNQDLVIKELKNPEWESFKSFYDFEPAWENNNLALKTCKELYSFFGVEKKDQLIAFAIINNKNGDIPQFGVLPNFRNQGVGKFLFSHISTLHSSIRSNNIDASAPNVLKFLESIGLKNTVNQYEMVSYL
ncbi:MAG: GNAT family N-acetyltransferase [Saprospiraceae bacterium]